MIAIRRVIGLGLVVAAGVTALQIQAVSSSGAFSTRYEIIDLGTLGGGSSVGIALNDLGHVVGSADTSEGVRHGYLWRNGLMTDLGTLPDHVISEGWDINIHDEVAGISSVTIGGSRAFLWREGQMTDIGRLGQGGTTTAHGINDAGQIVGSSDLSGFETHAYLWSDGVMTDLGTLGGTHSVAWDINASGQVVGESFTGGGSGGAFLWENGMMINLGNLGAGSSEALGINNLGQVVGRAQRSIDDNLSHAFVWEDDQMTDLGAILGVSTSSAEAINNKGQIIGSWYLYHPDDGILLLEDAIPPDSGWSNMFARDINNKSQICGVGTINGLRHAFLMDPLPPIPTTSQYGAVALGVVLLAAGILLIARKQHRLPAS